MKTNFLKYGIFVSILVLSTSFVTIEKNDKPHGVKINIPSFCGPSYMESIAGGLTISVTGLRANKNGTFVYFTYNSGTGYWELPQTYSGNWFLEVQVNGHFNSVSPEPWYPSDQMNYPSSSGIAWYLAMDAPVSLLNCNLGYKIYFW